MDEASGRLVDGAAPPARPPAPADASGTVGASGGGPRADGQRPLAVIDVDGVVADVRHRLRYLRQRPGNWEAFFAAAADDPPLPVGVALVRDLAAEHDIVWLTGRPQRWRADTRRWLAAHGLPAGTLRMRPDDDRRPARVFKRTELRRLGAARRVAVVVDDDPAVIALLERDGWPVLRADWLPYEDTLGNAQEVEGRT